MVSDSDSADERLLEMCVFYCVDGDGDGETEMKAKPLPEAPCGGLTRSHPTLKGCG